MPSTPRSTIWRKLKKLGVAQIGDGLVALPADGRTREALDWIADEVIEYGGEASVWLGRPADSRSAASIRDRMSAAVAAEYAAVAEEATAARTGDPAAQRRIAARLRRELHRIEARDFFTTAEHDTARRAVSDLAIETPTRAMSPRTTTAGARP
jgi:hypothetical protein